MSLDHLSTNIGQFDMKSNYCEIWTSNNHVLPCLDTDTWQRQMIRVLFCSFWGSIIDMSSSVICHNSQKDLNEELTLSSKRILQLANVVIHKVKAHQILKRWKLQKLIIMIMSSVKIDNNEIDRMISIQALMVLKLTFLLSLHNFGSHVQWSME